MISFEDLDLIFYYWLFNRTIYVIIKKNQFKQHFATTFRPLTKYIMILIMDQGSEIGKL